MSFSFLKSLSNIESYAIWSSNREVWIYDYLVENSTGTYAVSDAYYENNTFASTWSSIVGDEWKSLKNSWNDLHPDIYASREDALTHISEIFDLETFTETTSTAGEVLESLGPNAVNEARQYDSI